MEAGAGAFVFVDIHDFPPGRNKRKTAGDGNAGVDSFLCSTGRGRLFAESLSDGLVDRDFADGALPVRLDFSNIIGGRKNLACHWLCQCRASEG